MGRVTRAERRWVLLFSGGVMTLTCLPYLVAWWAQTTAWQFGGFLFAVEDGNSYIAKMNLGAHGAWLFTLLYSSEPQRGALVFPLYLALGKLAGPSHTAQVLWFHLARVLSGGVLLAASYDFLARFLPRVRQRRLGLLLVALGGGLGWLLTLLGAGNAFGSLPVDFISPEAFSFLILFGFPHLALGRALLLWGVGALLDGRGRAAGLYLLGLGFVQPLSVAVAWLLIGVWVALDWRRWRTGFTAGLLSAPMLLYSVWAFTTNPILAQWMKQNSLLSPHPLHYLAAYGPLLLAAVFGWRAVARRQPAAAHFILGWLLLAALLPYLPIGPQRRLIEGAQLPLTALAAAGVTVARGRWRVPALAAMTLPTTLMLLAGGFSAAGYLDAPVFHPADQLAAFDWLNAHGAPGEVALSSYATGNSIPAYTPLRAYIGHGPETVFFVDKDARSRAFFQPDTPDAERLSLLADGRIRYVIVGPAERALGDFDAERASYLRRVFSGGAYDVYEVTP